MELSQSGVSGVGVGGRAIKLLANYESHPEGLNGASGRRFKCSMAAVRKEDEADQ